MRVVLDTNVIVSAILFAGPTSRFVTLWQSQQILPLVTREIVEEFIRVFAYPKFKLTPSDIKGLLDEIVLPYVEVIEPSRRIRVVHNDPSDDKFLECAVSGKAERLVSGDTDLLAIGQYHEVIIQSPSDFLSSFP